MVSIPRLLIIGERGYCNSDAHWLKQVNTILDTLDQYPAVALQVRNKHHPQSWNVVKPHVESWMDKHPKQCLLNGLYFPNVQCARHLHESQIGSPIDQHWLHGASIHSLSALYSAISTGVHYVQYGSIFRTSKPVIPVGIEALQTVCETSPIPVLAVGGISTGQRVHDCLSVGSFGVSVGSWIMQSQHPATVIHHILEEISLFMSNPQQPC